MLTQPGNRAAFGVDFWPQFGKPFQRIKTPDTGEKERFRKVLGDETREGFDWRGFDADHVLDLNLSGEDKFSNLWPRRSDVNQYAGWAHLL